MSEPLRPNDIQTEGVYISDDWRFPVSAFRCPRYYREYLEYVMLPGGLICDRISQMAHDIAEYRRRELKDGDAIVLLAVLKGAACFHHHLREALSEEFASSEKDTGSPAYYAEYMSASSYTDDQSNGDPKILGLSSDLVKNRHVIIVEDLIDTGTTVRKIKKHLLDEGAASIKVATLLVKRNGVDENQPLEEVSIKADFCGFNIPSAFVVGFGIDYNQRFRDVLSLCVINELGREKFKVTTKTPQQA